MYIGIVYTSDRSGTQNQGVGFGKCHREMSLRQVEQGFSSFFVKLLPYLKIFFESGVCRRCCGTLKIIKYAKNLAKNEAKHCSTCLKPIFRLIPDN